MHLTRHEDGFIIARALSEDAARGLILWVARENFKERAEGGGGGGGRSMILCGVDIDRVSLNDLLVMDGGDDVDPGCLNDAVA